MNPEFSLPPFPKHPLNREQKLAWIAWGQTCAAMGMERAAVIADKLDCAHRCGVGSEVGAAIRAAIQQEPE